jgi:hypothetical protein
MTRTPTRKGMTTVLDVRRTVAERWSLHLGQESLRCEWMRGPTLFVCASMNNLLSEKVRAADLAIIRRNILVRWLSIMSQYWETSLLAVTRKRKSLADGVSDLNNRPAVGARKDDICFGSVKQKIVEFFPSCR